MYTVEPYIVSRHLSISMTWKKATRVVSLKRSITYPKRIIVGYMTTQKSMVTQKSITIQ